MQKQIILYLPIYWQKGSNRLEKREQKNNRISIRRCTSPCANVRFLQRKTRQGRPSARSTRRPRAQSAQQALTNNMGKGSRWSRSTEREWMDATRNWPPETFHSDFKIIKIENEQNYRAAGRGEADVFGDGNSAMGKTRKSTHIRSGGDRSNLRNRARAWNTTR